MTTRPHPTTKTPTALDLVARALDEAALVAAANAAPPTKHAIREAAQELLDQLDGLSTSSGDEAPTTRIETDEHAVRVVDRILDENLIAYGDGHHVLADETATRIVDTLLGAPIGTETEEASTGVRTVTLQWPSDDVRAALVAREVLEAMVAEANRLQAGADFTPVAEGVDLTPGQTYAYLLLASPERRHELLADLLHQRSRGVRCWLHGHEETIDNLRRDLDVARSTLDAVRAELAVDHAPPTQRTPEHDQLCRITTEGLAGDVTYHECARTPGHGVVHVAVDGVTWILPDDAEAATPDQVDEALALSRTIRGEDVVDTIEPEQLNGDGAPRAD